MSPRPQFWIPFLAILATLSGCASIADPENGPSGLNGFLRVVRLQDYNTQVVLLGTMLLGVCGGIVGVFMLLRKRSLVGDVVGHAALPGIAIAFLLSQIAAPGSEKNLPLLIAGAFASGLIGAACVILIDRHSRIKTDAALAIVLSLFYGLGTALLTVVQRLPTASAAGLKDFLNGKTASLVAADVWIFAGAALFLIVVSLLLFKELLLICFDEEFAAASGWPVFRLDVLLTGLVAGVTIVGMQTVGLILVVAILIIPAAAARFWSDDARVLTLISAIIGGLAGVLGAMASAAFAKVAAGAAIVLSASALFVFSLLFGKRHGIVWRWVQQRRMQRQTGRHDLLRAIYELVEAAAPDHDISEARLLGAHVTSAQLLQARNWTSRRLQNLLQNAIFDDLLSINANAQYWLTPNGAALARRAVRNHRLWEMYLISHGDIAPSHVDCDADRIEHMLGPDVILELERRVAEEDHHAMPSSPHDLAVILPQNPPSVPEKTP